MGVECYILDFPKTVIESHENLCSRSFSNEEIGEMILQNFQEDKELFRVLE